MQTVTRRDCYAKRPELALYTATRQFHDAVLRWRPNRGGDQTKVAALARRTWSAVSAIRVAVDSRAYERHLDRAKEHLLMCLAETELIADEGHLPRALCGEAMARLDQLLRGIDELAEAPIDEWREMELPPLKPVEEEDEATRQAHEAVVEKIAGFDRLFDKRLRPVIRKRRAGEVAPAKSEPPAKAANDSGGGKDGS